MEDTRIDNVAPDPDVTEFVTGRLEEKIIYFEPKEALMLRGWYHRGDHVHVTASFLGLTQEEAIHCLRKLR